MLRGVHGGSSPLPMYLGYGKSANNVGVRDKGAKHWDVGEMGTNILGYGIFPPLVECGWIIFSSVKCIYISTVIVECNEHI